VCLPNEVKDLARGFHAGVAAAHHDEGEEPAPRPGVLDEIRLLEAVDEGGAQPQGVGDVLHRPAVLRHAGNRGELGHVPERQDEVPEPHPVVTGESAPVKAERP
jgi:hypothetical protein